MSEDRSCAKCPFFLSREEAATRFKRDVGVPMCGVRRIPLTTMLQDDTTAEEAYKKIATGCKFYTEHEVLGGDPKAPMTATERTKPEPVMLGIPSRQVVGSSSAAAVLSCKMCPNYLDAKVVGPELGWAAGLCGAYGQLVQPNELVVMSKGCPSATLHAPEGMGRVTLEDVKPLIKGEYAVNLAISAIAAPVSEQVAPDEYTSDFPVTPEDEAAGIKAWRKIKDPKEPSRATVLPIYSESIFTEDELKLIPRSGDDEHPELYVDHYGGVYALAVAWSELNETPACWGEAGTGKTELFRHMAYLMQCPFRRMSITDSTELDDLAGKMRFVNNETVFQYGRLPQAWSRPGVICLDEPNTGPPAVWQFIRPLTDNSKQLVLDLNEGEIIPRHPDAYLGMAMNPAWDARNIGAHELGDADTNRLFHVSVPLPSEDVEKEIIRRHVALDGYEVTEKTLAEVMNTARDIRGMIREGSLVLSWAIRPQIKVTRALKWFRPVDAYRRAVGDFLDPEQLEGVLTAVRANFAEESVNKSRNARQTPTTPGSPW